MRTKEERQAWERGAMGCTVEEMEAINLHTDYASDKAMLAASILSDTQELLAMDLEVNGGQLVSAETAERVRQHLNRAKHFIFDVNELLRKAERKGINLEELVKEDTDV